jgi:hypothetical protein
MWEYCKTNEVDEKKNRHSLEVARDFMFMMNVPKFLWGEGQNCCISNKLYAF